MQVPLSEEMAVLIGLVASGAVAFDVSWLFVRHVMVMADEGAHAAPASLPFLGFKGDNAEGERRRGVLRELSLERGHDPGALGATGGGVGRSLLAGRAGGFIWGS